MTIMTPHKTEESLVHCITRIQPFVMLDGVIAGVAIAADCQVVMPAALIKALHSDTVGV
jgi:hypothetical protein